MNRLLGSIAVALWGLVALPAAGAGLSGAVVMHGQGESPSQVADLVSALQRENVLVVAPELPWSGRRSYDRSATDADAQVDAAISGLRDQGARRVYLIGHSLGASYALRYGSRPGVNGIVAIAPNHAPESPLYITSFANEVRRARELIAQGKPQAILEFLDLHWGSLRTRATATARSFLSYFDAAGPMNMTRNVQALRPDVLVLWIVPLGGDRGARQSALDLYKSLPYNAGSRLVELPVDYRNVTSASVPTIVDWMQDTVAYIRTD